MKTIFREILHNGLKQEITITKIIVETKSKYQKIQIFDTPIYGRILVLDGIIQITEKDEAAYSEMLVHPAIQVLKNPQKVLIIGGGDGAVAEEVLKYNFVVPKNNMLGKTTSEQSTDGWRDDKFPRKRPYITPSLKTLETFVKSGKAIAYLPDYLVNSENYQVLSITGCPYDCKQEVYLLTRNKKELGWINQVF